MDIIPSTQITENIKNYKSHNIGIVSSSPTAGKIYGNDDLLIHHQLFGGQPLFLLKNVRRFSHDPRFIESNPSISATATSTSNFWNTAATRGRGTPHEEIQRWDRKNAARIGFLAGGWTNPFEKYPCRINISQNWIISPDRGWK